MGIVLAAAIVLPRHVGEDNAVAALNRQSTIPSFRLMTCGGEVVRALGCGEGGQGVADGVPELVDGVRCGAAQQGLQPGEGGLDRAAVRRVGRIPA